MTDKALQIKQQSLGRLYGVIFSIIVLLLIVYAYVQRNQLIGAITHDPMSLLPHEQFNLSKNDAKLVELANDRQNQYINDKVIFLITSPTPEQTQTAIQVFSKDLSSTDSPLKTSPAQAQKSIQSFIDYYAPHQLQQMSSEQRLKLETSNDEQITSDAMSNAMRPISLGLSAEQDPLGNLQNWFLSQLGKSPIQPNEQGEWQIDQNGKTYSVLFYQATNGTFSLNTQNSVLVAYENAKQDVLKQNPNVEFHVAGIPMHAAAASAQANKEISLFGSISMAGIVLLIMLAFRSFKSVLLVSFSLFVGTLVGFITTVLIFKQIHVVTLVFGTSLIGVAQDYGVHFIAARQNMPKSDAWQVRRFINTSLFLALVTTVLAYACLGLAPFPGLRQIAVFSVIGLLGAWLTVVILFPMLTQNPFPATRAQQFFSDMWLRFINTKKLSSLKFPVALVVLVILLTGWFKLSIKDDLRNLQNSPQWLIENQNFVSQIMGQSNSQYFIVTGNTPEELLVNEEKLREKLDGFVNAKELGGYRAISEWLPSVSQQKANESLSLGKIKILESKLGLQVDTKNNLGRYIKPEEWLQQPVANMFKSLWLGQQADQRWASIVNLTGKSSTAALGELRKLQETLPQTIWVDNLADYSSLMSAYSYKILNFIGLAYMGTLMLLSLRFKKRAFLILLPPIAATALVLAFLGWMSIPIQLFTVLPLLLILGMGVDYGIFLVEHVEEQQEMWLTICLCASSTMLSLGVLSFSSTPALHILGLTLTMGITATWIVSAMVGKLLHHKIKSKSF